MRTRGEASAAAAAACAAADATAAAVGGCGAVSDSLVTHAHTISVLT